MQELIFIIILAVFIGGMLWSDRDSRSAIIKGFKFIGFDNNRYYSTTRFTVGEMYHPIEGTFRYLASDSMHSEATFKDDGGRLMWEELRYFKAIT